VIWPPAGNVDQRLTHLGPAAAEPLVAREAGAVLPEVELVLAVAIMREQQGPLPGARRADAQSDRAGGGRLRPDAAHLLALGFLIVAIVLEEILLVARIEFELQPAAAILEARSH
jgi:hypothetical protein